MEYRLSFEEGQADLSTINAEINDIIEEEPSTQPNNNIPIKKLSDIFDDCVQNQVNDNSHFKVFLRVRPLVSKGENTVSLVSDNTIVTHAPDNSKRAQYTKKEERHYAFHKVFGPKSQQLEVYNQVAHPLFDKFVQGESCLLFAYGMTNAGKTYTIQGSQDNQGLLPRLIGNCIKSMEGMANATLTLSILEIYQERIFDLLCVDKMRDKLAIRDACGKVDVPKLSIHPLVSVTEAMKLLDSATEKRAKSDTLLNSTSSRSHAVYSVTLSRALGGKQITSVFQVVDLAGAERSNRTKGNFTQQKEANNINMSLMQLWRCLQCMKKKSSNSESSDVIPFRESKLTHLLMPILCRAGLSGVGLIACINPQVDDYDETISILGNASLASKIKEISDIGRTMGPSAEAAPAVDPKKRKMEPPLAKPPKKPKATQSAADSSTVVPTTSVAVPLPLPLVLAVNSSAAVASEEETPDEIPPATIKSALRSTAKSTTKASVIAAPAIPSVPTVPLVEYEELEKESIQLRSDVRRLTEENTILRMMQIHREHEIRVEVSEEMAVRTSQLLMQLESLQKQLNASNKTHATDITKSVRKAQKRQREVAKEDESCALVEAESEIRRLKEAHEQEISQLLVQKAAVEKELKDWRTRAETATNALARNHQDQLKQQKAGVFSPIPEKQEPAPVTSKPVAEKSNNPQVTNEFYKRMERDSRFMKSAMNESENTNPVMNSYSGMSSSSSSSNLLSYSGTKPVLSASKSMTKGPSLSPSRSPLSVIRGDGNSPIRLDALNLTNKPIIDKQKLVAMKPQMHASATSTEGAQSPSVKRFRTRSQRV